MVLTEDKTMAIGDTVQAGLGEDGLLSVSDSRGGTGKSE